MYDLKTLAATPRIARRFVDLTEVVDIDLPDSVVEIANSEPLPQSERYDLNDCQQKALQYLLDHKSRGLLLQNDDLEARQVALASMDDDDKWPMAILTTDDNRGYWKEVLEAFPEKTIGSYGSDSDVFLVSHSDIRYNFNTSTDNPPKAVIVDGLARPSSVDYRWDNFVRTLAKSFWHTVYLVEYVDGNKFPDPLVAIQGVNNKAFKDLIKFVSTINERNVDITKIISIIESKNDKPRQELAENGMSVDSVQYLRLFGVCDVLVKKS